MQIKCRNVITLAATNVDELDTEWDCLLDTQESGLVQAKPFESKHLGTTLSDVCLPAITDLPICLDAYPWEKHSQVFSGNDYFKSIWTFFSP
jgi:hypothetical protein